MGAAGTDMEDPELLARVSEGDMNAMKLIYERHADAVQRFVRTRLRDPFEVADVTHNTMLEVWRSASRFQGRASVRSWMLSIARNKAVDHIRKQARTELAEPDDSAVDDAPNPEAILAHAQDAKRVRDCVEKLPGLQRSAVHLAFFEDMSYAEAAEAAGVPEGTIKTRIFHAKKLLMRCLSK